MSNIVIKNIGKEEAVDILSNNISNRKITKANVAFIKDEMVNGRFTMNGATIVISEDGELLDGQHRLTALIEADMRFDFIFVMGAKREIFKTIDTGKVRGSGDILSIEKVKNSHNMASAIRRVMDEFRTRRKTSKTGTVKLSNTEIYDYYINNKYELETTLDMCMSLYNSEVRVITPSVASALLILFSRENKQKAKSFIREIYTGNKEFESNAAQTLRKRLLNYKIEKSRLDESIVRALAITAFKAYKENRDISKIVITKNLKDYLFKEV